MSPKSTHVDSAFLGMGGYHSNPYRDNPVISEAPLSPAAAWPAPLSPCLLAEPTPVMNIKPVTSAETMEANYAHEFAPQGIPSAYPASSTAFQQDSVGYSHVPTTTASLMYPVNSAWTTQSYWATAEGATAGAASLVPSSVSGLASPSVDVVPVNGTPVTSDDHSVHYPVGTYHTFAQSYQHAQPFAYVAATYDSTYGSVTYGLTTNQGMTGPQIGAPQQFMSADEVTTIFPAPVSYVVPSSIEPASAMPDPGTPSGRGAATLEASGVMPPTPDCSLTHHHIPESAMVPPGAPVRPGAYRRRDKRYRYVTFAQNPGAQGMGGHYVVMTSTVPVPYDQGSPASDTDTDTDTSTDESDSWRFSSSFTTPLSPAQRDRQRVLDTIPPLKLREMRKIPIPTPGDNVARDRYIVMGKSLKLSYGQIRAIAGWTAAESTLRGRFRNCTKEKHERVRKPEWTLIDIVLLQQGVLEQATTLLNNTAPRRKPNGEIYRHEPGKVYTVSTLPLGIEKDISWKGVGEFIINHGGTYRFGAMTTKKKWFAVTGRAQQV
ncbi:conserved hypothetical protein [Talaromyces stipitatus ATCC 10500]|uniref:Uncharacterized protein n=1 Tax=Talaromyces stipitatus (strain ATCC 10500 / CBS 375.48 / QM 6759 / NRRL 1006) TaxID=441959 RepID=B8ME32_TALSN|nr:uncharacterized protein TSTA_012180 [Talaromyces stipitatus ATCC 10500]EED16109.1 conserved hypothetical protein [Talaromyces stipitatus ATCC 10500]